ncbi:MAG TPA: SCO family protein [Thermoanaerobaculia bacterium]|nr:SCO family protein [Thermoanaerobaculia bacterium]
MWPCSRSTEAAVLLGCALALAAPPGGAADAPRYSRTLHAYRAPDVALVGMDGAPVRLRAELERAGPVVLHFLFTSCATVCPVLTGTLAAAQERLPDVRILSISIDPEEDTPARVREYAARFGAGRRWRFLTGKPPDVLAVQEAFDAYRGDKMRHEPSTFLRAAPGAPWVRIDGFLAAADLVAEVERLPPAAPAPAEGDARAGERIYRGGVLPSGAPLAAVLQGDVPASGRAAACATCHRRSGFGGVEGTVAVPPITAPALFAEPPPTGLLFRALFQEQLAPQPWSRVRTGSPRPPYGDATLAVALREGHDPTGRALDPLMPRYQLSEGDLADLTAYLRTLGATEPPGVEPARVHFATVVTPDAEPARRAAWLEVAAAYVRWRNAMLPGLARKAASTPGYGEDLTGRRREWVLHVWELAGPEEGWAGQLEARLGARPVFALLGGAGGGSWRPVHEVCERRAIPCLFPDTDLPVLEPSGDYTIYFSGGLEAEGEALARHLLDGAQADRRSDVLQVYRDDVRGRAAAAALRRGLAGEGRVDLAERALPPDAPLPPDLLARGARALSALVLWLPAADLAALPPPGPLVPRQVFVSGTLLGKAPLAPGWQERSSVVSPFRAPGEEGPHGYRTSAWLRSRGAAGGGTADDTRHRLTAHWVLSLADHALAHLGATLSRDAFVEAIEREAEREPNPGVYPRLSLGPGQRVAAKVCTVRPL